MSDFTNSFFRRNNDSYGYAKQDYDTFKKNYDSFDFDAYLKQQREEREKQEELRRLQEEQEKNSGFFKGGDSNFFVGALNSYIDFSADIGQGFFRTLEGVADFLQYSAADSQKMGSDLLKGVFGDNPVSDFYSGMSNWFKENAAFDSTGSLFGTNENAQETLFGNQWRKDINEKSYLGDMADSIGEGIGNIGAMAAMSAVGGEFLGAAGIGVTETGALTTGGKLLLSGGNSYMSAYGNSRSEAYKNGATDSEAQKYAFVNGLAEAISEQVFDSMPGIKSAGFADKIGIKDALANKIKSGLGTNAGKVFLKLTGGFEEGAEEMISNALVAVGQDIIHSIDNNYNYNMDNQTGNVLEDFKNALVSEDSIKSFMSAGLTSVILGVGGDTLTTAQRNQVINAFAKDNNMSFKEAKQLLGGETLNQAQEQVQREIKRDNAEISNNIELEEAAKNRIVNYMKQSNRENIESGIETLVKEEARKAGIELNEEQLKSETEKIRNRYIDEVNNPELYRTFSQKTDNEKDAALAKSFEDAKLNDSKETHKIYKTLKVLQDNNENSNYKVVSNEKLVDMGILEKNDKGEYVLPDGTKATINGFKQGDTIYINADGLNPYEATIGHEIGEAIKSSDREAYSELKTMVKDLFNPSEKELQAYSKLYNGNTDSIEDEYVNDKLGELFKNDKLIDKIADNRTILQKFIDEIKRLVKYKFSNQEQRQLMDLQKKLEDKYVELYKQADFKGEVDESLPFYEEEKPQFSLSQDSQGKELTKEQQEYFKDSKVRDEEGRLIPMYHGSPNGTITEFKPGTYFTSNEKYADRYQNPGASSISSYSSKKIDNPKTYQVYLNMKKPFDTKNDAKARQIFYDEFYQQWGNGTDLMESGYPDWVEGIDLQEFIEENHPEYDGFIVDEGAEGGYGQEVIPRGLSYIVMSPEQVKNIDNTNPTSNPDIRYSLSEDNQGRTLSQGQQDFVRGNAKELYDSNGKIKTYYHTTTNEVEPFDVFNPVGTPGYKYGDVVVNFYTDNPIMSGSYADSDYVKYSPEATEKAKYQYEGYISMKNPFVVDSEERSYGRANIKANESATKVINVLNNLSDDTIKELAAIKQEAGDQARQNERLVNQLEYLRKGMDKEQQVALQIGEILDATEKYNLNEEAQERNNRLIQRILEKEGFSDYDLDNLKYEYYTNIFADDLSNFGVEQKNLTLKDFAEIEKEAQSKNLFTYEIFDELIKDHINNEQIKQILDTTFDVKQQTRVLDEETGTKQYGKLSDLVYDAIEFDGTLNRKYLTKEGLQEHYVVDGLINQNTNDVIREVLEMNKNGANYDGVVFKNLYDYGGATYDLDSTAGDVVVTFNSNQFKDFRNENPTSGNNINYSLSQNGEMVDNQTGKKVTLDAEPVGDLMAIHNLNEEKLNGILDLGGFPYPSIAITKPSTISHEGYGDISVIFKPDAINPELNAKNKVYSRDAYTPRFPTLEYKVSSNESKNIRKVIGDYDYRNPLPGDKYISEAYSIMDNLEDNINRSGLEKTLSDIKNNPAMKYVYLKDTNQPFDVITRNEQYSSKYDNDTLQRFLDNYNGEYDLNELPSSEYDKYADTMWEAYKEQLINKYKESNFDEDTANKLLEHAKENFIKSFAERNNFAMAAYKLQKYGENKQVLDSQATKEKLDSVVNQEEYEKWVDNLFKNIIEKKGLRNNKDYYTASGTPRSFEQLHDEYTLDNVVKILDALNDTGEESGFFYGISEIAGNASKRFNTIEDIKSSENLLATIGNEEYQQMLDNISDRLGTIQENIMERENNNSDNYFIARDNMSSVIADAARIFGEGKKIDAKKIQKMLNDYGFNATIEESQQILDMYSEMRELPTQYFEAKPKRAVGFDEIGTILIPNNASEELKQRLTENNISYEEYNPEIEGDRQAKENQFEEYMFSLSEQQAQRENNLLKVVESYDDYLRTLPSYQQLQERQSTEETNLPYTDDTHGILTKADYKNKKIELFDKKIDTISNRMEEQAKRFARQNLELSNKNKQELTELLQEYTGLTREGIFSSDAREKIKDFVKNHSRQEFVEEIVNEDVRDLQKAIRNTQFIIDKESAGEFADGITAFKKNNPGLKIKYGKSNIDSVYQELAETYPGMLETDVNDKDIPFILADFLKKPYRQFNNKNVQVFQLSDEEIDNVANKIYYGLTNNAISEEELQNIANEISEKVEDKYARQMASQKYRDEAREAIEQIGIENIKDKKRGIQYKINTMKRNLRDIMSKDSAQLMYDKYFKPITIHNAQSEVDKQSYVERIQKYGLTNDESVYTQMLGEQKYNPESDVTQAQLDEYASKHNIDKQKCTEAVEEFRNIYDELIVRVNESLKANGYKPIEYRQGYFPHFIEDKPTSIIGKLADKLGWHIQKGTLPTDIAGITEGFKPGKTWTSFSQQRTGDATDYNALKGMDNYLRGAMDLIYHTEDIQRLRALENELRYQYSEKGMQEKIDAIYANDELSPEEKAQEISLLVDNQKNNPLGNFVTELRDYTNSLANKKSILDRGMEQSLGRDWYSIMNNINGRVSANMVGANISSAMTNFIPLTQAWSQVSTKNLMRGMYESLKNTFKNDGFDQNSVYLTNRTQQADTLYKTLGGKINEKLGIPFEAVDSFTSNAIVRAKYYENLEKGMSEQQAIENADEFAKDVMAGRSKGDQPTIFNTKNPIYKLFTAFQLEVNNQYGYMFKDIPADLADEAKDKLAAAFVKMFLGAWIYNFITEKLTGRKAAFSPIDMAIDEYKTATNENLDFAGKVEAIAKDIAEEVPFAGGMMGGGRLPIQAAIPYDNPLSMITSTIQDIGGAFDSDESKKNTAINNLKKEWLKPVYYLGLPFAGGQIKKTNEGLAMYNENLPTPGSYTSSGKLRFEADTSPLGKLQAAVFGQYASENAREYFDKGYSPLSEKQVNEAMDANLPIAEYREVNKGIAKAKKIAKENGESQSEAQYNYIYNLPISMEQKNSLINSKLGTSENVTDDNGFIKYTDGSKTYWYDSQNDIVYNSKYREMSNIDIDDLTKYSNKKDLTNYGDYGSLEEFNYANNNPSKYKVIQQITDYNSFKKYKDDLTAIKDNYNDGTKAGQNKAKQEVFNYINGLELNVIQKLMLQKMAGGYSINNYKSQIRNYIQNLNMTAEEKKELDDELF